jgi:hypothetical protein
MYLSKWVTCLPLFDGNISTRRLQKLWRRAIEVRRSKILVDTIIDCLSQICLAKKMFVFGKNDVCVCLAKMMFVFV